MRVTALRAVSPLEAFAAAGAGGGPGRVSTALVPLATTTAVASGVTDASGAFRFAGLPAGAYTVVAERPSSLSVTWDSQGAADAAADVELVAGSTASAQVGLVGDAAVDLQVRDATGGRASGVVVLRWAGVDGVLGTADDVDLTVTAVDGRVQVGGLPAGSYRVVELAGAAVSVSLVLASGETVARRVAVAAAVRALAATGAGDPVGAFGWALLLVVVGAATVRTVRRASGVRASRR